MKQKSIIPLVLITTTLFTNATELKRDGWNLISICQDINRVDIDMSGIKEIQAQDGKSIYTGSYAKWSNLDKLDAGYGYWVKGTNGVDFASGESKNRLEIPLLRDGWNLIASCDDIAKEDIDMTNIKEIQAQDGKTIYTGDYAKWSNLEMLELGYGYWVRADKGTLFVSKYGLSIPKGFEYQTINNSGEIVETTYKSYKIKIFSNHNEVANAQSNHIGIGVNLNNDTVPIMQIQEGYRGKEIVVAVYNSQDELIGVSDKVTVDTSAPVTEVDVTVEQEPCQEITDTHPDFIIAKDNTLKELSAPFNGFNIVVTTDENITTVSNSTNAIYGLVDGDDTNALFKLNSNYGNDSRFVVKAYRDGKLVGISEVLDYGVDGIVEFGEINGAGCGL